LAKKGIELKQTDLEIAKQVQNWLIKLLKSGPIVAMVLRGNNSIEIVRKIVGGTEPRTAAPGTIRGDYATDSYQDADRENRAIKNIAHASESEEEAKREIQVWFKKSEEY